MNKRKLGGLGLEVSQLGLGCMGMSFGLGEPGNEQEMIQLIRKAIDNGINFLDTAQVYGPNTNEILVGKAIAGIRDKVVIATKFGFDDKMQPNSSPELIRETINGSLKRLNVDCIDLIYQHRVDPNTPIEEVAKVVKEFIDAKKVKYWGLSEAGLETIIRAHKILPLSCVQFEYSMMWREPEDSLFKVLEELNIGLVAYSPLARGFLTNTINENSTFQSNDIRSTLPWFEKENMAKNKKLVNLINEIANKHNFTSSQIALAWVMRQKPWIVPIPGTRKESRLLENIGSTKINLSESEWNEIDKILNDIKISGHRYNEHLQSMVRKESK